MIVFNSFAVYSQETKKEHLITDHSQVPAIVRENFTRDHPGSAGTWSREGEHYRVEFIDRESRLAHAIVYDSKGKVVRRDSELESVPEAINEYYHKNYPGEKLRTWSVEEEDGARYFYSNRESEALRFDQEGHYIKPENKKFTPAKNNKTNKD